MHLADFQALPPVEMAAWIDGTSRTTGLADVPMQCASFLVVLGRPVPVGEDGLSREAAYVADSGEADALEFHPGGFVGHTSGTQRYAFEPGDGERLRFSLRATGEYKQAGISSRGTMRAWGRLSHGRTRSYDFNY